MDWIGLLCGTEGRNRTGTPVKEPDFESGASTSSATPAQQGAIIAAIAREWEGLSILF